MFKLQIKEREQVFKNDKRFNVGKTKKVLQYFQRLCEDTVFVSKNAQFRPKLPPPYPTIVFKSISGLAPTYLSTLFTRNSTRETVNLRNRETDLLAPRMKTSNGQKAFSFRGSKVWNELEHEVKLAPSLSTFNVDLNKNRVIWPLSDHFSEN